MRKESLEKIVTTENERQGQMMAGWFETWHGGISLELTQTTKYRSVQWHICQCHLSGHMMMLV